MNDTRPLLAPEVEALLVELAADPASCLLRAPRARALPARAPSAALVAGGEAFLTRAERQLVRVHREEVASALTRMAALAALKTPRLAGTLIVERPPERRSVGEAALRLLAGRAAPEGGRELSEALARAADPTDTMADWEPAALLTLALRLAEPRGARQWWPLVLCAQGHDHAAWRAALELEEQSSEPHGRALAASNAALAAWHLGRHADAADAYARAYRARPDEDLYLAFHHLNVYLAWVDGIAVECVAEPFPAHAPLARFIRASLRAAPVPGWSARMERARAAGPPPRPLGSVAEVLRGTA